MPALVAQNLLVDTSTDLRADLVDINVNMTKRSRRKMDPIPTPKAPLPPSGTSYAAHQ